MRFCWKWTKKIRSFFVCPFVCSFFCLFVCLLACPFACPLVCLLACPFVYPFACPFVCPFVYASAQRLTAQRIICATHALFRKSRVLPRGCTAAGTGEKMCACRAQVRVQATKGYVCVGHRRVCADENYAICAGRRGRVRRAGAVALTKACGAVIIKIAESPTKCRIGFVYITGRI